MSPFLSLSSEHGTPVPGALCKQPESVREPKVDPAPTTIRSTHAGQKRPRRMRGGLTIPIATRVLRSQKALYAKPRLSASYTDSFRAQTAE